MEGTVDRESNGQMNDVKCFMRHPGTAVEQEAKLLEQRQIM